ncbi:MAG: thiamine pyrophosphate-binding protein, partial [Bacilli bacterium]|nr:thiamine pyrophosphate-binding protein [Bacilli bacterium]
TQHNNHNDRYAQTTAESGYSVPDFQKIAEAYGLRAVTLESYSELDKFIQWLNDDEACLINVKLSQQSVLLPKIKFETNTSSPARSDDVINKIKDILK